MTHELWKRAGGGTPGFDVERYKELMREHGHLVPLAPGERAEPLPCGWPRNVAPAHQCARCGRPIEPSGSGWRHLDEDSAEDAGYPSDHPAVPRAEGSTADG